MKFVYFCLLFSVFLLAACSSGDEEGVVYSDGEIAGVALIPSEQGSLNLYELTASEWAEAGAEGNPGYVKNPEKFFAFVFIILPKSVYYAGYIEGEDSSEGADIDTVYSEGVAIETFVYTSEDRSLVLGAITDNERLHGGNLNYYNHELALLYKGNTFVIVRSSLDSYPASDIADKLSRRLGMSSWDGKFWPLV